MVVQKAGKMVETMAGKWVEQKDKSSVVYLV